MMEIVPHAAILYDFWVLSRYDVKFRCPEISSFRAAFLFSPKNLENKPSAACQSDGYCARQGSERKVSDPGQLELFLSCPPLFPAYVRQTPSLRRTGPFIVSFYAFKRFTVFFGKQLNFFK